VVRAHPPLLRDRRRTHRQSRHVLRSARTSRASAEVDLAETGRVRRYTGHPFRYVTVDDHDNWTTWAEGAGYIVNRKPSVDAGCDPEPG
jgi:hypothetical protein